MKTECIFAASISPYTDGELSAEDTERIRLHLKICPACQTHFRTIIAINEQLAAIPEISPSPDFERNFWQKIDVLEKQRQQPAWKQWLNGDRLRDWRPALATAAGIIVLCGTLLFTRMPMESELSIDEIAISQNMELLTDYEIVRYLDLLEHWTDFSENDSTDA